MRIYLPDWTTFDWRAALLTLLALALVFLAKCSVVWVLAISAIGGLILSAM
jgi:chromate transporter